MTFRRQAGGNPRAGFGKAADVELRMRPV